MLLLALPCHPRRLASRGDWRPASTADPPELLVLYAGAGGGGGGGGGGEPGDPTKGGGEACPTPSRSLHGQTIMASREHLLALSGGVWSTCSPSPSSSTSNRLARSAGQARNWPVAVCYSQLDLLDPLTWAFHSVSRRGGCSGWTDHSSGVSLLAVALVLGIDLPWGRAGVVIVNIPLGGGRAQSFWGRVSMRGRTAWSILSTC